MHALATAHAIPSSSKKQSRLARRAVMGPCVAVNDPNAIGNRNALVTHNSPITATPKVVRRASIVVLRRVIPRALMLARAARLRKWQRRYAA